jgi:hypothetical protein
MNNFIFDLFLLDLKNENVKHFHVPYYESLSIK